MNTLVAASKVNIIQMVFKYGLISNHFHVEMTNLFKLINKIFVTPILLDTRYLVDSLKNFEKKVFISLGKTRRSLAHLFESKNNHRYSR